MVSIWQVLQPLSQARCEYQDKTTGILMKMRPVKWGCARCLFFKRDLHCRHSKGVMDVKLGLRTNLSTKNVGCLCNCDQSQFHALFLCASSSPGMTLISEKIAPRVL
jgi:hypothetical protein